MRQTLPQPHSDRLLDPAQTDPEAAPALRESRAADLPHQSPARRREDLARRLLDQQSEIPPQGFDLPARLVILLAAVAAGVAFWSSTAGIIERLAAG